LTEKLHGNISELKTLPKTKKSSGKKKPIWSFKPYLSKKIYSVYIILSIYRKNQKMVWRGKTIYPKDFIDRVRPQKESLSVLHRMKPKTPTQDPDWLDRNGRVEMDKKIRKFIADMSLVINYVTGWSSWIYTENRYFPLLNQYH